MNKYFELLQSILDKGRKQDNKKGSIAYLTDVTLKLNADDIPPIFASRPVAKRKLAAELDLYMEGRTKVEDYRRVGITWWDYCGEELVNTYPTYMQKLPALIDKIKSEKRNSKNYVLYIGETGVKTSQLPCLSLIQFQIEDNSLIISAYQRSSDASLGMPSDIYQLSLIAEKIGLPLKSITIFFGNAHIYENNIEPTKRLLAGSTDVKFTLNT